jgi:hypothetical protein
VPNGADAAEIINFLCEMAQLTWREIEGQQASGHKRHHSQPVASINADARAHIGRQRLDEVFGDAIFRFRLSGQKRLWGFRKARVFHVLWWDHEHRVYETEPD